MAKGTIYGPDAGFAFDFIDLIGQVHASAPAAAVSAPVISGPKADNPLANFQIQN